MIDFRYHLVSIVSVFLALAVGIVLGAGPLKEDIGATLTSQVTQLRSEKTALRADLGTAEQGSQARDTYAADVLPLVIRDQLANRTVALVVLPGADSELVKKTTATLRGAGGTVGPTITLTGDWADPQLRDQRNQEAVQLAPLVDVPVVATNPDQLAATVLTRAILTAPARPTQRPVTDATKVLKGFSDAGVIKVSGSVSPDQGASSAVVVGGPQQSDNAQDTRTRVTSYLRLTEALDAGGSGAVLVNKASATPDQPDQLISALRVDASASVAVSSVDDGGLAMGQGALVLALAQQYAGGSGHYGLAKDAKAVAPDVTTTK